MKKLLSFVLAGTLLVSCADYDDRFDSLNQALTELEAENAALEAQIAAMQGASAQAAQATAIKLAQFQLAIHGIIDALDQLGDASEGQLTMLDNVISLMTQLASDVLANSITLEEIDAALAEIQALLDLINENVLHHSGGGSHTSGGTTDHHSGGGHHHSGGGSTNG